MIALRFLIRNKAQFFRGVNVIFGGLAILFRKIDVWLIRQSRLFLRFGFVQISGAHVELLGRVNLRHRTADINGAAHVFLRTLFNHPGQGFHELVRCNGFIALFFLVRLHEATNSQDSV